VLLKFPPESLLSELQAMSRNVSLGGLLLEVPSRIPQHSSVSFTLTMQGDRVVRPILLAGEGKVVRVEPEPRRKFAVAVECSRPITQIERYLPSPGD
jgi:PilZ domain